MPANSQYYAEPSLVQEPTGWVRPEEPAEVTSVTAGTSLRQYEPVGANHAPANSPTDRDAVVPKHEGQDFYTNAAVIS